MHKTDTQGKKIDWKQSTRQNLNPQIIDITTVLINFFY